MYELEYLQIARLDILEAEVFLYEHNPQSSDNFVAAIEKQEAYLVNQPYMFPVYEARPCFRMMPLPYKYLCFYHICDISMTVTVHRILHCMRDISNISLI